MNHVHSRPKTKLRRWHLFTIVAAVGILAVSSPSEVAASERIEATFPEPVFVDTNGIRMAVYESGEGPAVVFCHGFPEIGFSWRNQLGSLSDAGFHAIAPDQRGYGLTDRPDDVEAYSIIELCNDLVGLLDARGIDKAVFCGHDWGGFVVWMMPVLHPDRVAGVIGVNTPLMPPTPVPPVQMLKAFLGEDNYIVAFQEPGVADEALAADVRKTFSLLMRRGAFDAEEFAKLRPDAPERKFQLLKLLEGPVEQLGGAVFLSDEELDFFVDTFERTGFTGGINWYRNIDANWEKTKSLEYKIDVPCLYVGAEDDVVLPPSSADGMEKFCSDLEKKTIADCGHWTQQEKPEEFNQVILEWLERKIQ